MNELGLFALIVPSLKRDDLLRDGRFSLHAFPVPQNEDAFCVTGTAGLVEDVVVSGRIVEQFLSERGGLNPALVEDELRLSSTLNPAC